MLLCGYRGVVPWVKCVPCQHDWRGQRWQCVCMVVCQCGRRACVVGVSGVPAWIRWVVLQCGWHSKVSRVGNIRGNSRVACQTVLWVAHYFSNSFLQFPENKYCSKLEKDLRFQIIQTSNTSYFSEFPWIFEFKVILTLLKRCNRLRTLQHIQNLRFIRNLVSIPYETLAY